MANTTVVVGGTKEGDALAYVVTRSACPFYGFVGIKGVFLDNKGNACGLEEGHRPCAMEMNHETPGWKKCQRFNHDGNHERIETALNYCQIFPEELRPKNKLAWKGISLRIWYQLIMRE